MEKIASVLESASHHGFAGFKTQKDMRDHLLAATAADQSGIETTVARRFNMAVVLSWILFTIFMFSQPWLANWANNTYFNYSPDYTVYAKNGGVEGSYRRSGLCTVPAAEMHCTDGQNFTSLALKSRGVAVGCGCGQGLLGEGLCPMTSYGYTVSDFVSTPPAIAAMLGLSWLPIAGAWIMTFIINERAQPNKFWGTWHFVTLGIFHWSYLAWGISTDCVFPTAHSVLTVVFIGSFVFHWDLTAGICIAKWGFNDPEAMVVFLIATTAVPAMVLGSVPRIFLVLNDVIGSPTFPNWNHGLGSYAFWFGEALSLSLTFGAYPITVIVITCFYPERSSWLKLTRCETKPKLT